MVEEGVCFICRDARPRPIQAGCACRGDSGLGQIHCLVQAAVSQQARRGDVVWRRYRICKQYFTGSMQTALAEAWSSLVVGQAAESPERLAAQGNLAESLLHEVRMRSRCCENYMRCRCACTGPRIPTP